MTYPTNLTDDTDQLGLLASWMNQMGADMNGLVAANLDGRLDVIEPAYAAHAASHTAHGITDTVALNYLNRHGIRANADWIADMRTLRTAAATRLVNGVCWGASVEEGYGATNRVTGGFIGLSTTAMQAIMGDGGSGFISVLGAPVFSSGGVGNGIVTTTGSWTPFVGGLAGAMLFTTTVNATITFTVRGTSIRVWYAPFSGGGTITVTIDGVAQAPFATNATSTVTHRDFTAAAGTHTVIVKNDQANGAWVYGVEGRNATGYVMHNLAHWGQSSPMGNAVAWPGAGGTETSVKWSINSFAPDLYINAMGGNDVVAGTSLANFQANANILDLFARIANPNVLGMYVTDHIGENDVFAGYHAYADIARLMCETKGLAWYNAWSYGHANAPWMINNGYLLAANVHPTDAGCVWQAAPVTALLSA